MNIYIFKILALLCILINLVQCSNDKVTVSVKLQAPCVGGQIGDLYNELDEVEFIKITISGPDFENIEQIMRIRNKNVKFTDLPPGKSRIVTVKGYQIIPTEEYTPPVLVKGSIGPMDLDASMSGKDIYIVVSKTNQIVRTTSGNNNGQCTNMNAARVGHTATLLNDGRVLITGGVQLDGNGNIDKDTFERTAEIYDPKTGIFTPSKNTMSQRKAYHSAVLIESTGEVLLTGGLSIIGGKLTTILSAEFYNPNSNSFSANNGNEHLHHARAHHTSTYNHENQSVVITGGYRIDYTNQESPVTIVLNSIEVYRTTSKKFEASQALMITDNRAGHTSSLMVIEYPDNTTNSFVIIAGGENKAGVLSSVEIYDTGRNEVLIGQSFNMAVPRVNHSANVVGNGQLLLTGGYKVKSSTDRSITDTAELINILNESPSVGTISLKDSRAEHVSFLVGDTVYLLGGYTSSEKLIKVVEYIKTDITLDSYMTDYLNNGTAIAKLEKGVFMAKSAEIGDGILLLVGGAGKDAAFNNAITTSDMAQLFIPQ